MERDIQTCMYSEPEELTTPMDSDNEGLDAEQEAVVWWLVVFTCTLQTLHSLSLRAVQWLLKFLAVLLTYLGRYSNKISRIAKAFPSTLYLRAKYLNDKMCAVPIVLKVVCPTCHSLYNYTDCIEKRGTKMVVQSCTECRTQRKQTLLLRSIVTCKGSTKFYPFLLYPYCSLISSLKSLLLRPGFLDLCERWRQSVSADRTVLLDVYDGKMWQEFMVVSGVPFLAKKYSLAFMLNIDWFQPYKHRTYSIGVMYLSIMNLPRNIRFKRENIILLGLIPGPQEPPLTINTYLTPLVCDLLLLWDGLTFDTHDHASQCIRCALLCVACDLPAARKVCGFLSHSANLGCSRCYRNFGTGVFGIQDYSGFDRESWVPRSNENHRRDVKAILSCSTKTEQARKVSELGCRYSCLLQLPYFNPVKMMIIDPMHNLYIGTAKHILHKVWIKQAILSQSDLNKVNQRIASVTIPSNVNFSNLPSVIESSSSFTAEQMMVWVNFYSLFCLHGLLSEEQLECWRHFVLASRILSKRQVTAVDISIADALLLTFCRHFERLNGGKAVTPNMHLQCHLTECVKDYGPMSSFWLFSFERYNGILGDRPTNNRAIEPQLLKRFIEENLNLQLLATADISSDADQMFSPVVKEHAFGFYSLKHLDTQMSEVESLTSSKLDFVPASKYTIGIFQEYQLHVLMEVYKVLYRSLIEHLQSSDFTLPCTYHKMDSITIRGQRIESGQYVQARPFFAEPTNAVRTVFTNPDLCVGRVTHFAVHSFPLDDSSSITHAFAVVDWVEQHSSKLAIGKPYEIWSRSYKCDPQNFILPLECVSCLLLCWEYEFLHESVLITVPLL